MITPAQLKLLFFFLFIFLLFLYHGYHFVYLVLIIIQFISLRNHSKNILPEDKKKNTFESLHKSFLKICHLLFLS